MDGRVATPLSDARIFEDVYEALTHDGELDPRYIRVAVENGVVFLDGLVASERQRELACALAERVAGVRSLVDRLFVERHAGAFAPMRERGVLGQLVLEHRLIAAMFDIALDPSTSDDERVATCRLLARDVLAHAHAEETVVYHRLDGSREVGGLVDHARDEHARIERLLDDVLARRPGEARWLDAMAALRRAIEAHVREEELELIPRVHYVLDDMTIDSMRDVYLRVFEIETRRLGSMPLTQLGSEPSFDRRH